MHWIHIRATGYYPNMAFRSMRKGDSFTYHFVTTPPVALICPLCQLVVRDPQLSCCCGTNFCKQCVDKTTNEKNGCPACNNTDIVFASFPNKMSEREVKKLIDCTVC